MKTVIVTRPIEKLYLDMDDVLTDCTGDALRHMGILDYRRENYPHGIGRDVCKAYQLFGGIYIPPENFWQHFKRGWWAGLTPTPWCYDLIDLALKFVDKERLFLLTYPTQCGDCHAGKWDWIEDKLPEWFRRQYDFTPQKLTCAAPGSVLIDDCDKNIKAFESNATPGKGIVFPQPWNSQSHMIGRELDWVEQQLTYIEEEGLCYAD